MSSQTKPSSSVFDTIKLCLSVLLVVTAIGGFYYFAEYALLYRVLGVVGVSIVAIGLVLTTARGGDLWEFVKEARVEVRKVIWPTRQETLQTTLIVMVMVTIVGLFLWLLDMFFLWGVQLLTGQVA